MNFLPLTLPNLEENLACDEALLLAAEQGDGAEILRIWEYPIPAVVLGAAAIVADDVRLENCTKDNIPVGRRSSGGGTVLLGPGCLLFSLILNYKRADELTHIGCSYCYILGKIRDSFGDSSNGIEYGGTSDLAIAGRKFSGNSQQRKRNHLLHHGSILYDFDLAMVGEYLQQPQRQPDYRENRGHGEFLMNLPIGREEIESRLRNIWEADDDSANWPEERMRNLVVEKYARDEWTYRR